MVINLCTSNRAELMGPTSSNIWIGRGDGKVSSLNRFRETGTFQAVAIAHHVPVCRRCWQY